MGDWSILGRFLTEVQNHSTVIGKIWLTMLLIFRILLVTLVGDAVYSDEQSKFTCNTLQPGCNNVCYDTFAPVSHLRFWVFQIVLVSTPSIFYVVYVLHKIAKDEKLELEKVQVEGQDGGHVDNDRAGQQSYGGENLNNTCPHYGHHDRQYGGHHHQRCYEEEQWGPGEEEYVERSLLEEDQKVYAEEGDEEVVAKDPTQLSSSVLLIYIVHVLLRSVMEITFLVGQYYLFGFEVPHLFRCQTYPCPTRTDCFVSRATEKTIFLNFMFSVSLGCFLLNIVELHYLGWVYIFRVLCSACSLCCRLRSPNRGGVDPMERFNGMYTHHHHHSHHHHNPLLLQLKHSLRGRLILQPPADTHHISQEKGGGPMLLGHAPAISFQTDSTLECTSKRSPEERDRVRLKLANMAKMGRGKKSWL
ncbi:gap junction delta-2 protein [Engraulis encrasicolus]|uniref:gap junction delta-2 protein n=1 Tax=Engraulis encrasicolus TaxID=184585 RepID=UPI002FD2C62A